MTPDQPRVLMQIQNIGYCRVASIFKADWGANGTPGHSSWAVYPEIARRYRSTDASNAALPPPMIFKFVQAP